jgi:uncharacterized protein with GYD domain
MIRPQFENRKEGSMPHYLQQVAYSQEGWEALVANPQNRIEAVRPAIEKLGGKIETAWFSFGDYDIVVITEMPDNVSAAAIAMAFAAGGACKSVQTTPLISVQEATQALKKAKECGYRPATASGRAA